jgi:hypothetical protein
VHLRQEGVDHLRVADELHRDEPERCVDLVLADLVDVALDRSEDEMVDVLDARKSAGDRVRLRKVEPKAAGAPADLARSGVRARLIPTRDDDVPAVVCVRLGELAAESLRAADDDDGSHAVLLSHRRRRADPHAQADPATFDLDRC